MTTRAYHSPSRAADAAATRARIVAAAGELFIRDGYASTSMRAIAAQAGVSLPTVHLHGPKHALLIAAFERTFAGDEGAHSLAERPALVEIMAEPDHDLAVRRYVAFVGEANTRSAGILRAMILAADADPGARTAVADLERRRLRDMGIAAEHLAQRGIITRGTARAEALLGLYTGPEAFLHLVHTRGWTREAYEDWLLEMIRGL